VNVPHSPLRVPSPNCSVALWNSSAVKNVLLPLSSVISASVVFRPSTTRAGTVLVQLPWVNVTCAFVSVPVHTTYRYIVVDYDVAGVFGGGVRSEWKESEDEGNGQDSFRHVLSP
jgi:hypothetical protein